jgi:hypothetical protein
VAPARKEVVLLNGLRIGRDEWTVGDRVEFDVDTAEGLIEQGVAREPRPEDDEEE